MVRENIVVQVGQCGMQIGTRFWDLALREHAFHNPRAIFDDSMSTFFRNVDARSQPPLELKPDGKTQIYSLRARAVLIDMEEGVINQVFRSPLGELFDQQRLLKDVSGSGNNWAHGHCIYGPQYHEQILDSLQSTAEACDSLQSFMMMHSLGGGTGSGLGTYLLDMLSDNFPEVLRFSTVVWPSKDDDVVRALSDSAHACSHGSFSSLDLFLKQITSPYNALLSLNRLSASSDCVLPLDNQQLLSIVERVCLEMCYLVLSHPITSVLDAAQTATILYCSRC